MCKSKPPKTPQVIQRDPQKEAAIAARKAAQVANNEVAATNVRKRKTGIAMDAGSAGAGSKTLMQTAAGKDTLGG